MLKKLKCVGLFVLIGMDLQVFWLSGLGEAHMYGAFFLKKALPD